MDMGYRDLVSETEAAAMAGISARTLRRFINSGYLHVEHDADGLPLLEKEEVARLFGVRVEKMAANAGNVSFAHTQSTAGEKIIDLKLASALGLKTRSALRKEEEPSMTVPEATPFELAENNAVDLLQSELDKLKHVLDVQEKLLEEREREVHQLMGERDWLRKRIERLEEKGERDQILLLSETQALRKLVNAQVDRRSPVRAMLEWFGITAPASTYPVVQVPHGKE